jgi:predicted phosphodiesterase
MKILVLMLGLICNVAMAKQYTFYTDTHVYSPYLSMNILPTTAEQVIKEQALFLGDIVEGKNAEPEDCYAMKTYYENLRKIAAGRIVLGNHDGRFTGVDNLIIDGKILITHGDRVLWDKKKSDKFRAEAQCQGSGMIQKALAGRNGSISNSEAKEAANYARAFGMKVIVFGHVHVKYKFDQVINGVRVISLPRGKTVLDL